MAASPCCADSRRWCAPLPPSLSPLFCLGSMPGTLVCSSLRSRQACWAAPSATQCDALLPLPFTPLSPLLFPCRGLTLSMWSTSTCDTAARSCRAQARVSGRPRRFLLIARTLTQKLLTASVVGSGLGCLRSGVLDGGASVAQPNEIVFLIVYKQTTDEFKVLLPFPCGNAQH